VSIGRVVEAVQLEASSCRASARADDARVWLALVVGRGALRWRLACVTARHHAGSHQAAHQGEMSARFNLGTPATCWLFVRRSRRDLDEKITELSRKPAPRTQGQAGPGEISFIPTQVCGPNLRSASA